MNQQSKAEVFAALHARPRPFVMPNPWDAGTTRLLSGLGFEAVATTSLGLSNMLGRRRASRSQILDNCREVAAATELPVNADLENGFADDPGEAAKIVADAHACGVVGGSIEDFTGDSASPIYDFSLAVERVAAAVEVARSLPTPFVLTARAENLLYGVADLDESIRRLQAFEKAGADVLYAPGLRTLEEMRTVVSAVSKPINVVMGFADPTITVDQLADIGVRRITVGGALSRVVLRSFLDATRELKSGRFTFIEGMAKVGELHEHFVE